MKTNHAHITIIVDRSGSMRSTLADAQGGFDAFVAEQKAQPGTCSLLLIDFDNAAETKFGPADIQDFTSYLLVPRGSTALLDAIGYGINETGRYLNALPESERPEKVIFLVVTDGGENDSREFTATAVKPMIELQTNTYKWQFVFIGSDQAAVLAAQGWGIGNTASYASTGPSTRGVYAAAGQTVSTFRGSTSAQTMAPVPDVDEKGSVIPR